MAVIKKVTVHKDVTCAKCTSVIASGSEAIKDRRGRAKARRKAGTSAPTLYYDEVCYKRMKGGE